MRFLYIPTTKDELEHPTPQKGPADFVEVDDQPTAGQADAPPVVLEVEGPPMLAPPSDAQLELAPVEAELAGLFF